MYKQGFIDRVIELLEVNDLSGYKLSLKLGKSKNYINNILHGNHMPSIDEFFNMCTFFHVSPVEFFDYEKEEYRNGILNIIKKLSTLSDHDLVLVEDFIDRMIERAEAEHAAIDYLEGEDEITEISSVAENDDEE